MNSKKREVGEDNTYQLIEDYLLNRMDSDARRFFEQRMKEDAEFAEEVEMHQLLHEGLAEEPKRKAFDRWSKLHAKHENAAEPAFTEPVAPAKKGRIIYWMLPAVAAALALFFFVPAMIGGGDQYALIDELIVKEDLLIASRNTEDSGIQELAKSLATEQWEEAIAQIEKLDGQSQKELTANELAYYKGLALLKKRDYKKAEQLLAPLSTQAGFLQKEEANYNYLLALAGIGEKEKLAREIDRTLKNSSFRAEEIRQLQ